MANNEAAPPAPPAENIVHALVNASRVPDTIKLLPTYDGDSRELSTWIQSVETTLALYVNLQGSHIYRIWLNQIRLKIIGKANEALTTSHTPTEWAAMRATLVEFFGDRRDISSLNQKIFDLQQKNRSVEDYYHEATTLLADITSKVALDEENDGHEEHIMAYVRVMVKDAFIDGLDEPYASYTRNYRPNTLHEAFQCAREQMAAKERRSSKARSLAPRANPTSGPSQLVARRFPAQMFQSRPWGNSAMNAPRPQFQQWQPRPPFQPFQQGGFQPNRIPQFHQAGPSGAPPVQQRAPPRPVPMEVDRTMRSNVINYRNRYDPRINNIEMGQTCTEEQQTPPDYYAEYYEAAQQSDYYEDPGQSAEMVSEEANEEGNMVADDVNFTIIPPQTPTT